MICFAKDRDRGGAAEPASTVFMLSYAGRLSAPVYIFKGHILRARRVSDTQQIN